MLAEKRGNLPGVDRFPGQLGGRVMPARKPHHVQVNSQTSDLVDHATRKVDRKSEIVTGGNKAHGPRLHVK